MPHTPDGKRRRRILKTTAVTSSIGLVGLAGCMGGDDEPTDDDTTDDESADDETTDDDDPDPAEGDEHELFIGSTYPAEHTIFQNMEEWAEGLSEETGGRIDVSFEPSFGGEAEVMEQTETGGIDGNLMGDLWLTQYSPELTWIASPFVLDTWEEQRQLFMETEHGETARENFQDNANQRLMGGPIGRGARVLTADRSIPSPDDLDGLELRVPEIEAWVEVWNGIGASATSVSFDELYGALEQGVVEGQENPPANLTAMSIWEIQSHVMTTDHIHMTGWMNLNQDTWDSFSDDDQELVEDTLTATIEETTDEMQEAYEEDLEECEENGMEIVEVDQDEWQEAAEPVLENLFESDFWDGSLEEARNP